MAITQNYGTGRRKSSTARVFLRKGTGNITVNGRPLDEFFGRETGRMIVRQPLELTKNTETFDITVTTTGGFLSLPFSGVSEACCNWEKALQIADMALFLSSESAGYITGTILDCDGGGQLLSTSGELG